MRPSGRAQASSHTRTLSARSSFHLLRESTRRALSVVPTAGEALDASASYEDQLAFCAAVGLVVRAQANYITAPSSAVYVCSAVSLVAALCGWVWSRWGWKLASERSPACGHALGAAATGVLLPITSYFMYACESPAWGVAAAAGDLLYFLLSVGVAQLHFHFFAHPTISVPLLGVLYMTLVLGLAFGGVDGAGCGARILPERAAATAGFSGFVICALSGLVMQYFTNVLGEAVSLLLAMAEQPRTAEPRLLPSDSDGLAPMPSQTVSFSPAAFPLNNPATPVCNALTEAVLAQQQRSGDSPKPAAPKNRARIKECQSVVDGLGPSDAVRPFALSPPPSSDGGDAGSSSGGAGAGGRLRVSVDASASVSSMSVTSKGASQRTSPMESPVAYNRESSFFHDTPASDVLSTSTSVKAQVWTPFERWSRDLRKVVRASEIPKNPLVKPQPELVIEDTEMASCAGSIDDLDAVSVESENIGGVRPFVNELKVLWRFIDSEETGFLNMTELQWLLEIMGVVMTDAVGLQFFDAAEVGSLCSRDHFLELYERFRVDGNFESYFGRIHLSAIGTVLGGNKSNATQARVIRIWSDFDTNKDGNLDAQEIFPILQVLAMPNEEGDIAELFAEFKDNSGGANSTTMDRIEYSDFISIFSCDHEAANTTTPFQQKMLDAVQVTENVLPQQLAMYCTEAQLKADSRSQQRMVLEKFTWVVLAYALFCSMHVLFRVSFERHPQDDAVQFGWTFFDLVLDVLCFGWIYFRVKYPMKQAGVGVIVDPQELLNYFMQLKHVVDLLVVLPLDVIGVALQGVSYSPFWRINKVLMVYYVPELWTLATRQMSPIPVRITGALGLLFIQAHILGCLFKITADHVSDEAVESVTTLRDPYFSELSIMLQYWHSLDYAMKTMTGWGRGQPIPSDDIHVAQACLIVITGVAAFSFVLASISNALQIRTPHTAYCERMDEVKSFLAYSNVPKPLGEASIQYYNHVYRTQGTLEEPAHFMDDLPFALDVRLRLVQVRSTLAKVPIFADAMLDDGFVYALSLKLVPFVLCPGERVCEKGARGSNMYFITHGLCEIVGQDGAVQFSLHKGDFFGEIALLHNVRRTATIVSATFCNVLVLSKPDFEEVCEYYPQALERIREAAMDRLKQIVTAEARLERVSQRKLKSMRKRHSSGAEDASAVEVVSCEADVEGTGRIKAPSHTKSQSYDTLMTIVEEDDEDEHCAKTVDQEQVNSWLATRKEEEQPAAPPHGSTRFANRRRSVVAPVVPRSSFQQQGSVGSDGSHSPASANEDSQISLGSRTDSSRAARRSDSWRFSR